MVITFLPFEDIESSLRILDQKRLNKLKLENIWILKALDEGESNRLWKHPAVLMWIGHRNYLIFYHNKCIEEWQRRGYNTSLEYLMREDTDDPLEEPDYDTRPYFIGWLPFHLSHLASLMRKHPEYYSSYFLIEQYYIDRGYIWPSHHDSSVARQPTTDILFAKINISGIKPLKSIHTVELLKQICRDRNIRGYSKLNKLALMLLLGL